MVRGLTDKESLDLAMERPREDRKILSRVKQLAMKGASDPQSLTPDEVREMCESLLHQIERRQLK